MQKNQSDLLNAADSLTPIQARYLLVTCIECYRDRQGRRYLDQLWYKDLIEHFVYLKNFTLAAPCAFEEPPKGAVLLDGDPLFSNIQFVDLPAPKSFGKALRSLPVSLKQLWKAVGQTDIVHTGVAGWPIPPGWLVTPIVWFRRKFYIIIVESAFWRLTPGVPATLKARIMATVSEWINRLCVNTASFTVFTQNEYRQSLLTKNPEQGHVIHASWIDEQNVLSEEDALSLWAQKVSSPPQPLRILFVGRLTADKGVGILLSAMQALHQEKTSIRLDILGQGDLLRECEAVSQPLQDTATIGILGTVPYGPQLFQLLQSYHAVVIPSISDEQPRIVYDAYSQGLPVLASNTPGLRDCVYDGQTGILISPNDPGALADALKSLSNQQQQLSKMGMAALAVARDLTHQEMHRRRWRLLLNVLKKSYISGP